MNTTTTHELPTLLTLGTAANHLSISRRTLERLISAGEFPSPLKIGRSSRVSLKDVENYCEQLHARRIHSGGGAQ